LLADFGAAGQVSNQMADALDHVQRVIQVFLESALRSFAGDKAYSEVYTLPGTGATVGVPFADDADQNVALCLVPQSPTGQSSHGLSAASFRLPEDRQPTLPEPPVPNSPPIS